MAETQGQFDASHGQLRLTTGVAGRAAKMGHRLTIAMERWQAAVSWSGQRPTAVALTVEVDSLQVLRGDGGLTPLTAPEKALIRSNARNCLDAGKHALIRFGCNDIESTDDGYRLAGTLEIRGKSKPHVIDVRVDRPGGSARLDEGEAKLGPPHQPSGSARLDEGEAKLGPPHQPSGSARLDGETVVRHSDFGVRRYSMLMGAMQVADAVTVSFSATVAANQIRGS